MQKVTEFWKSLTEFQRATIRKALADGVVSPEITNRKEERAYIDGIQINEKGEEIIYGQVV